MPPIRFKARLHAPMAGKGWTFATMPKAASAKLPKRGRVPVKGTVNGFPFRTSAFPDGEGSHMIQMNATMRKGAGVEDGDTATFVLEPASDQVKVTVPADLKNAVAANAKAKALWATITPKARAEWVAWVTGAKREETRTRRVKEAAQKLAKGQKRPSE